jgi:ribosomal protein L11
MKTLIPMLVISSLALASCSQPPKIPMSSIRVVHAIEGGASLQIQQDDTNRTVIDSVTYKNQATYKMIPTATQKLYICQSGITGCSAPVTISLQADKKYTFVVVGTDTNALLINTTTPDDATPATAGQYKVKFIHAASAAAAKDVDVYVKTATAPITGTALQLSYKDTAPQTLSNVLTDNQIRVFARGATTAPLINIGISPADTKSYTVVFVGNATPGIAPPLEN